MIEHLNLAETIKFTKSASIGVLTVTTTGLAFEKW